MADPEKSAARWWEDPNHDAKVREWRAKEIVKVRKGLGDLSVAYDISIKSGHEDAELEPPFEDIDRISRRGLNKLLLSARQDAAFTVVSTTMIYRVLKRIEIMLFCCLVFGVVFVIGRLF